MIPIQFAEGLDPKQHFEKPFSLSKVLILAQLAEGLDPQQHFEKPFSLSKVLISTQLPKDQTERNTPKTLLTKQGFDPNPVAEGLDPREHSKNPSH